MIRCMRCRWARTVLAAGAIALPAAPGLAQVSFRVNEVIQVSASDDERANCAALRQVLADIPPGPPAARLRTLVRLEPGIYDCGSTGITVKSGVALEGLGGRYRTEIRGQVDSETGLVHLEGLTLLRSLSVRNGVSNALLGNIAVSAGSTTTTYDIELEDVSLAAVGDSGFSLWLRDSHVRIERSTFSDSLHLEQFSSALLLFSVRMGPGFYRLVHSSLACIASYDFGSRAQLESDCTLP